MMSQQLASPYINRFYGRATQIREFFRVMGGPTLQPLRVLGFRRAGKTSFLLHIAKREIYAPTLNNAARTVIIAYVDLQNDVASPTAFFREVSEALQETLRPIERPPVLFRETLRSLRRELTETQKNLRLIEIRKAEFVLSTDIPLQLVKEESQLLERLAELQQQVTTALTDNEAEWQGDSKQLPADFHSFKQWMQAILKSDSQLQIIVLLDEFEVLTQSPAFDQSFFGNLRALAGPTLFWRFTWVTATYRDLHLLNRKMDESDKTSPFFNLFFYKPIILGSMDAMEVEQLIRLPAKEFGINLAAEEVEAIKQIGGAIPYFVQVTADEWLLTRSLASSLADCRQRVLERLLDTSIQLLDQMWRYWRHLTVEERECICAIAERKSSAKTNSLAEQNLLRFGLLCEKDGQIQISGEVFRQWLNKNLKWLTTPDPCKTTTPSSTPPTSSTSGGVTILANTINMRDVTGRDKLEVLAKTDSPSEQNK